MTDMGIEGQMCTRPEERILLDLLQKKTGVKFKSVERRSTMPFDLSVTGVEKNKTNFQAWLPLHAIGALVSWTDPIVAKMTDYKSMAMSGDWSGVRDTDNAKLWEIFHKFVLPLINPYKPVMFPQDKERLRQAANLVAYVRNDVSAMDHTENLPPDVKEALQKLQEAETLLNRIYHKAKVYGSDIPFPS